MSDTILARISPLEKAVLDAMLDQDGESCETIRKQSEYAVVTNREFTGVGFFTDFAVPPNAPVRLDLPDASMKGVTAEFPASRHGAGFVLFIRDGALSMLEGFTYDEPWPSHTDGFRIVTHPR